MMNKKFGYVRVAAAVPELKVANVDFNVEEIVKEIKKLSKDGVQIVTFPELSITGYTCGDLFKQDFLLNKAIDGLKFIVDNTSNLDIISIVGMPLRIKNKVYDCAVLFSNGEVLDFELRMWLDKDTGNEEQGKKYKFKYT